MYFNELQLSTEKSVWYNVPRIASHCPNSKLNLASKALQKRPNPLFQVPVSTAILSHLYFGLLSQNCVVLSEKGIRPEAFHHLPVHRKTYSSLKV